jgi:tetratricopeptide (TPR) repeat protein
MIRKAPRSKYLFFRVGFLYLFLMLFFYRIVDVEKLQLKIADELKVPIDYLILFSDDKVPFDSSRFHQQVSYYEHLQTFVPNLPEIHGLLAFCYYYLGDVDRSAQYFRKAAAEAPHQFWFLYNLGIISYEKRDFKKAAEFFKNATSQEIITTLQFVNESRIYRNFDNPIIDEDGLPDLAKGDIVGLMKEHIDEAYANSLQMLVHCEESLKNYQAIIKTCQMALEQNIYPKGFFYYYLGFGAFELKRFQIAQGALQASLLRNPLHRESLRYLGLCYQELQNPQLARFYQKKFEETSSAAATEDDFQQMDLKLKIF